MEASSLTPRCIFIISLCINFITDGAGDGEGLVAPGGYRALSGDLEVAVPGPGSLQLLSGAGHPLASLRAQAPSELRFPCGVVSQGGTYYLRFTPDSDSDQAPTQVSLEVRWPVASVWLEPQEIPTFPETTVRAGVSWSVGACPPALGAPVPETWLDLLFCGHSPEFCTASNATHAQVLYSEQIRGYPSMRRVALECGLFGLAGHYALALRPSIQAQGPAIAATPPHSSLKAVWSDKFVFNVHARSIFPCEAPSGGVTVLFQYPACILEAGDRVRLYARSRPEVGTPLATPQGTLRYIAEQKFERGRHSVRFDCSVFSEKYLEYCFVYVSQAITGAVSDVRMDCVPTLPVLDSESGGWSEWSGWTECSTTCSGGTRNRYRTCDSPPPRYGAKFCQGHGLETESCGSASWRCGWQGGGGSGVGGGGLVGGAGAGVAGEVGPGCRCGCTVHLSPAKPHRVLAALARSCPGTAYWLVQGEEGLGVRLGVEQARLDCGAGSAGALRVRDGDSSGATLLAAVEGTPPSLPPLLSTGPLLLVEFESGPLLSPDCDAGFLAHASLVELKRDEEDEGGEDGPGVARVEGEEGRVSGVDAALVGTLLLTALASAALGLHYALSYRKARSREDYASVATNGSECGGARSSRATSSTSLLSEVISLKRFQRSRKHSRLEEERERLHSRSPEEESYREEEEEEEEEPSKGGDGESPVAAQTPPAPRPPDLRLLKTRRFRSPVSPVAEEEQDLDLDPDLDLASPVRVHSAAASAKTPHFNTSSSSGSSTITSGSVNVKASKEKRNRARALGGSEFSLELEMDYYDYNVQNAEPGCYLAMDPAYCLWIPPFAPSPPLPEKETSLEKEPYNPLETKGSEIKFADDEEEDEIEVEEEEVLMMMDNKEVENIHAEIKAKRVLYKK